MAVHDHDSLTELRQKWVKSTRNQPLGKQMYFNASILI